MKTKLIQMATLMCFVMSVVYMAQIPKGYGHEPSNHYPDFHIDARGYRKDSGTIDPRGKIFNAPICGTDGDQYVSEQGWYYRGSGELSGEHVPAAVEQVYRLKLYGEATASQTKATGKLSPSLNYIDALPLERDSWGGTGHINLSITELDYHYHFYGYCMANTVEKHEWNPNEDPKLAVNVHETMFEKTETSKVYADGVFEGAGTFSGSFGGSYERSWKESVKGLKGWSSGIKAEVGYGSWGTFWNLGVKLQKKVAIVSGDIDPNSVNVGAAVSMTANYAQAQSSRQSILTVRV